MINIEEYVKNECCKNPAASTFNVIYKADMRNWLSSIGIASNAKMKKSELYIILAKLFTLEEIIEHFKIGMSAYQVEQLLGCSYSDIRQFVRGGILRTVGKQKFRAYGKYMYKDTYNIFDVINLYREFME